MNDSPSMNENEAAAAVPEEWLHSPPRSLVVGDGAYARALAFVLGSDQFSPKNLLAKPAAMTGQGHPLVLAKLERVCLVASSTNGAPELIRWHKGIWNWVGRLSRNGDEHDLAIIFILPDKHGSDLVQSLRTDLALSESELREHGHDICFMTDSLASIATSISAVRPMDFATLAGRRRADVRHAAIDRLRATLSQSDYGVYQEAVQAVAAAFRGAEYQLDLFCQPPAHRNGNALRQWLGASVTGQVTPEQWRDQRSTIAGWLVFPQNNLRS